MMEFNIYKTCKCKFLCVVQADSLEEALELASKSDDWKFFDEAGYNVIGGFYDYYDTDLGTIIMDDLNESEVKILDHDEEKPKRRRKKASKKK